MEIVAQATISIFEEKIMEEIYREIAEKILLLAFKDCKNGALEFEWFYSFWADYLFRLAKVDKDVMLNAFEQRFKHNKKT